MVITALDSNANYLDFLDMGGTVLGPDLKPLDLEIQQTSPGRYVGQFDADKAGSYFVMVRPGVGQAPIRAGVNVPYSDEFRSQETNLGLLQTIADLTPKNGEPGILIQDPQQPNVAENILDVNSFRRDLPKSSASQDVWHLLVLIGSCLFFFDVFNRRVSLNFAWVRPWATRVRDRVMRREAAPETGETMSRLQSRKAAVDDRLEKRRAAARFEVADEEDRAVDPDLAQQAKVKGTQPAAKPRAGKTLSPQQEEESYTERLLKAKKKVWKDRDQQS